MASPSAGLYSGSLLAVVKYSQYGIEKPVNSVVWSGSTGTGMAEPDAVMGGTSGRTEGGDTKATDGEWLAWSSLFTSDPGFSIYALSSPITNVPEPSTLMLLASALLALGGTRLLGSRRAA